MLFIPPTSRDCYVSGRVALNIVSPDDTGEFRAMTFFKDNPNYATELYIYGIGQKHCTHHLLGDIGIIDGTARLNQMGYFPENVPVWIAEHPRACVDYLYVAVLQTGVLGRVMLDEWFPCLDDKQKVYDLLNLIEPKLTRQEREYLHLWQAKNPLVE